MKSPGDHVNAVFVEQMQAFAADLDERARHHYPDVLSQALEAFGYYEPKIESQQDRVRDCWRVVFTIVPGLLIGMKTGGDTRIAILDQTEGVKLYDSIRKSLLKPQRDDGTNKRNGIADAANSNSRDRTSRSPGGSLTAPRRITGGKTRCCDRCCGR